jgi:transglutaminase-like putative cysteine protease
MTFERLTLPNTVAAMYRLMEHTEDVRPLRWQSVREVFDAVRAVPYKPDSTARECGGAAECVKRPVYTLMLGGDCDDKTILAGAALRVLGIPSRVVTVAYTPGGAMEHTYLEVFLNGRWRPFDPTNPALSMFEEAPYATKVVWS